MIQYLANLLSKRSEVTKSIMLVASGTALAQAIPIIGTLILTRIYDPAEFGVFTVVISLVAFGVAVAAAKYDVAIVLPKSNNAANALSNLSLLIGFIACILALVIFLVFSGKIAMGLGLKSEDEVWLYWLPLFIFSGIFYQVLMNNATRYKVFKTLAKGRVGRSIVLVSTQVSLGYGRVFGGLMMGPLAGNVCGIVYLIQKLKDRLYRATMSDMKSVASEYRHFPRYTLLAGTINSFSNQIPIILMLKFFSESSAGYLGLTQRMLSLPIGLMANSILDVFKQKAAEQFNSRGNCKEIYLWTLKRLLLLSIPIFGMLAILAPTLFSLFFGEEWTESGNYARLLSVLFMARFVASPLSYVLFITGKQKYDLVWQICLAICTLTSFYIGYRQDSPRMAILLFSISYSALYLVNLAMSYSFACGNSKS